MQARLQQYLAAQDDESRRAQRAVSSRDAAPRPCQSPSATRTPQPAARRSGRRPPPAALGGGEDAYYSEISELADKLARGETIQGPGPKLAAAHDPARRPQDPRLRAAEDAGHTSTS